MAYEDKDADMLGKTGSTNPSRPGTSSSSGTTGPGASTYSSGMGRSYATTDTTHTSSGQGGMDQAKDKAGQALDQAKDKAGQALDQAKDKATEVTDQAQERAKSMLDHQKVRAADGLGSVADALRQTGQHLGEENQQMGHFAEKAADTVENLSHQLRDKNVDELFHAAESFARREPQLFLGGALVAGVLLARFLKSSRPVQDFSNKGTMPVQTRPYDYGSTYTSESYYPQRINRAVPPKDFS